MSEKVDKAKINEIFKEDELAIFIEAVKDVRRNGFGEVTLHFRDGYVYRVKAMLDHYTTPIKGKNKG